MALRLEYFEYLKSFNNTCTCKYLYENIKERGLIALRHDVDHDIDVALEMAKLENDLKIKATYFVLPGVSYWHEKQFIDKCLQIQDYGHEIGLHINVLAEWFRNETDDIEKSLQNQIDYLRNGGISISGISAHGDSSCYDGNFCNYWIFKELKPSNPLIDENDITAEGPISNTDRKLHYPKTNFLIRRDNKKFPLWSLSLKKFNLLYHAWHLDFNNYYSDSGGSWINGKDPINIEFDSERTQINMHPIYWKGPQRTFFFLSPARSGSLWLSTILENATSLITRHEYILNQDFFNGNHNDKLTFYFKSLEEDPKLVEKKIEDALKEYQCHPEKDFAEVNVYLSSFIEILKSKFPQSQFIHLYRNPADTIRSIMNRDWYDTPDDLNHPKLIDKNLNTKFERVCSYVFNTNKKLFQTCDKTIFFDSVSLNENNLIDELNSIGIIYHKRLAKKIFSKKINVTKKEKQLFKEFKKWTPYQKYIYYKGIFYLNNYLGKEYETNKIVQTIKFNIKGYKSLQDKIIFIFYGLLRSFIRTIIIFARKIKQIELPFDENKFILNQINNQNLFKYNSYGEIKESSLFFKTKDLNRHSYIDLFAKEGLGVNKKYYLSGEFEIIGEKKSVVSIFLISYLNSSDNHLRRLGSLNKYRNKLEFSSAPHPKASNINIRVYVNKKFATEELIEIRYKIFLRKHLNNLS